MITAHAVKYGLPFTFLALITSDCEADHIPRSQMWNALHTVGPNHLGLRLKTDVPFNRARSPKAGRSLGGPPQPAAPPLEASAPQSMQQT